MYAVDNPVMNIGSLTQTTYNVVPSNGILEKMARLYADVFADPPWNEYKVCERKTHFYGKEEESQVCSKCDIPCPLEIAYPQEQTVRYIAEELKKPKGTLVLFEDKTGEVLAAGWGYKCSIENFKAKYNTSEMQMKVVSVLKSNTQGDSIFYLSETMVDKRARNQGIATKIAMLLKEEAEKGSYRLVMRTHKDSPMAKVANKLDMERIIDSGQDSEMDGRVLYLNK